MSFKREESVYVLVIEDNQELREFFINQLADRGYKVMTADNGPEAIECIQNSKFHVAISDLQMPGMDGLAILEAIKKADPEIQVIVTSGYGDAEMVVDAMKMGAYRFLHRPVEMKELFLLIEKAHKLKKGLSASAKLEVLLETVMGSFQVLFHADEGSLMLMDNNDCLYVACSRGGLLEETVYSTALRVGERVAGLAAKEGRAFLIKGGLENHKEFSGIEKKRRILSSIVAPVFCQKKLIGVLNLNRTVNTQDFTDNDLQGVSVFVSQIAQAVQDAKLRSDLEMKARELKSASKRNT